MGRNGRRAAALAMAIGLAGGPPMATDAMARAKALAQVPAPLVSGDEAIVTTRHAIRTAQGPLAYEARAGRLPIRNDETGEVRAHVFFTAYTVKPRDGKPRPLTFIWNGGPTRASLLLHFGMFGPRRIENDRLVDNADTILRTSDIVFYDPVGTGFSRPASAEAATEFYSTLGDFAATAEFIRAYRMRFDAAAQPLFLAGESYGTWRVSGVAELLTRAGVHVSGSILISGGFPGSLMPFSFQDAMSVPARTAAAFFHGKLPPELMRDRAATLRDVDRWAQDVYWPALDRLDKMDAAEREAIARELARYLGVDPAMIDRKTLVVTNNEYLKSLLADSGRILNTYDMRRIGPDVDTAERARVIGQYFRRELNYPTDLAYTDIEDGYMPAPGPARRGTAIQWAYNHVALTPEVVKRMQSGGGPPASQPWIQNAMRIDTAMGVMIAAGRYDSYNMCAGNLLMTAKLAPQLGARVVNRCYDGGHMMYDKDPANRALLAQDVVAFIVRYAR